MSTKLDLSNEFPEALERLRQLKGEQIISDHLERLNEIYNVTEKKWETNIKRLGACGSKTKYLLVGEAAPFSQGDEVAYFYNEKINSKWLNIVYKSLFDHVDPKLNAESKLQDLAQMGFLLIDVLPFSVKYTSRERCNMLYVDMIRYCKENYFMKKINDPSIRWDSGLRIAFGVQLTCSAVKIAYNETIIFPNNPKIHIDENSQIGADGSGNPNSKLLKNIFKVE